MLIFPTGAQAVGDLLNDLPVGTAFPERLEGPVESLNASLRAGEGPFLFQTWTGRQNHIRKAAGLGEEDLLHHKEVQFRQRSADIIGVRIYDAHLFAEDVHSLDASVVNR